MNPRCFRPSRASNWRADNFILVPASQLPFKAHWAKIARNLPSGEALLVVPQTEAPLKQVARALVPQLRARGRHVTTVAIKPVAG